MLYERLNVQQCTECGKEGATVRILESRRPGPVYLGDKCFTKWPSIYGDAMRPLRMDPTPLAPVRSTFNLEPLSMPRTKKEKEAAALQHGRAILGDLIAKRNAGVKPVEEQAEPKNTPKDNLLWAIRGIYGSRLNDKTVLYMVTYNEDSRQTRYRATYQYVGKTRRLIVERWDATVWHRKMTEELVKLLAVVQGKHGYATVDIL